MNTFFSRSVFGGWFALSIVLGAAVALSAPPRPQPVGPESLHLGFQIATRIGLTEDDRDKAQWQVASEYLRCGDLELAWQCAEIMRGWRRGLVYAELAPLCQQRGRPELTEQALAKAKAISLVAQEWRGPRIAAHLARAHARLGQLEQGARLLRDLPIEEKARAAQALALALVERGQLRVVLADLRLKEGLGVYEVNDGLVANYLALARHPRLIRDLSQRRAVLIAARRVSAVMPPLYRLETDLQIATLFQAMNLRGEARTTLESLDRVFGSPKMDPYWRGPALAQLAVGWHRLGRTDRARALLAEAGGLVGGVQAIDRSKVLAAVAGGYVHLQEPDRARGLYAEALKVANELINARTRALAAVEVCVAMSQAGWRLQPAERQQLTALLEGLRAPW